MGRHANLRRGVEAAIAAVGLLVTLPLVAVGLALSAACYRAWPLFVHERVGIDGRRFRVAKIRTLPPSTARYADKYSLEAVRVPSAMRMVRKLHLDELPQLWHVVTGDMAFVGPRPEMPTLHDQLPSLFAIERTSVLPGLTGLWQISPHNAGLIGERTEYDRLYLMHRSVGLDVWILVRTIHKMALGRATHLFEVPRWAVGEPLVDLTRQPAPRHVPVPEVPATAPPVPSLVD